MRELLHGLHNRSCDDVYLAHHSLHNAFQQAFITSLLAYVIVLNGFLIIFVMLSQSMMACNLNKQLASSFCGNLIGACSLYINELIYSRNGMSPIGCVLGVDRYFFLYLGVSWNVIVTVLNTFYRYNAIVSLEAYAKRKEMASRQKHFVYCWFTAAFIALVVAGAASFVQGFFLAYQFLITVFISFIPLSAAIIWNILLTQYLCKIRENAKATGSVLSERNIERATFIIKITIITHGTILALGTGFTILAIFVKDDEVLLVGIIWFLRVGYAILFSVEAGLFLYKTPCARGTIVKRFFKLFPCLASSHHKDLIDEEQCTMSELVPSSSNNHEIVG